MAELAIRGHSTRGEEVIEILEMLGGVNKHELGAIRHNYVYFIDTDGIIRLLQIDLLLPEQYIVYSLEEFEEKYPYKVRDTVTHHVGQLLETHALIWMRWDSDKCRVLYYLDNYDVIEVEDILYSVECEREQSKPKRIKDMDLKNYGTATIKYIQENGSRDMELIIPYNQEIVNIDGRYILRDKKPQYPKTYEECYDILGLLKPSDDDSNIYGYKTPLLSKFQKLLICRDAYWKIAGEQMGLGKPWEPDWNWREHKFCIGIIYDKIEKFNVGAQNHMLSFPTEEMRDIFYECFKELIEKCKELL